MSFFSSGCRSVASKPTCPTSVHRCAPRRLADVGHVALGDVEQGNKRDFFLECANNRWGYFVVSQVLTTFATDNENIQ